MMLVRRIVLLGLVAALGATPVLAHHGWGSYDASRPFTITGPVKRSVFQYPHAHVMIDHDGKTWEITLAPPSRMEARGALAEVIGEGKVVAAFGYASTAREAEMWAERITVDGKTFEMR